MESSFAQDVLYPVPESKPCLQRCLGQSIRELFPARRPNQHQTTHCKRDLMNEKRRRSQTTMRIIRMKKKKMSSVLFGLAAQKTNAPLDATRWLDG